MAFCNERLPCGHTCSRQDPDYGSHDCFDVTCPQSRRYKPEKSVTRYQMILDDEEYPEHER